LVLANWFIWFEGRVINANVARSKLTESTISKVLKRVSNFDFVIYVYKAIIGVIHFLSPSILLKYIENKA